VHNAKDEAVQGLELTPEQVQADAVLAMLAGPAPLRRDHVKLDVRGTADRRTKHERVAAPAGTRFSFEIAMWGSEASRDEDLMLLGRLAALMEHPAFRLGGATRRGYGRVVLLEWGCLSLALTGTGANAIRGVRETPPSQREGLHGGLTFTPLPVGRVPNVLSGILYLRPIGVWRVGQGSVALGEAGGRVADALPLAEPEVAWENGTGSVRWPADDASKTVRLVVPASSMKGPLLHRMLFHYNRLSGHQIIVRDGKDVGPDALASLGLYKSQPDGGSDRRAITRGLERLFGRDVVVEALTGAAKSRDVEEDAEDGEKDSEQDRGQAGLLIIDDAVVEVARSQIQRIEHNSIDRFTGGVRSGALFAEDVVGGGAVGSGVLRIGFSILRPRADASQPDVIVKRAFCLALKDLCEGRLAFGAKRLGFCAGGVEWSGAEEWLRDVRDVERPPPPPPSPSGTIGERL
jgi:hypothetical protein